MHSCMVIGMNVVHHNMSCIFVIRSTLHGMFHLIQCKPDIIYMQKSFVKTVLKYTPCHQCMLLVLCVQEYEVCSTLTPVSSNVS